MDVTRETLQESFRLLNDAELLSQFHSGELTGLAQEVAAAELRSRGIDLAKPRIEAAKAEAAEVETDKLEAEIEERQQKPPGIGESQERQKEPLDLGDGDIVQVARFLDPMEAQILRGRLEAEGVRAMVADANMVQVNAILAPVIGGVRVLVPQSHLEHAQEIVRAIQRGDYALKDDADAGPGPSTG
jgi:Putative prokaryotic signal transducing protein